MVGAGELAALVIAGDAAADWELTRRAGCGDLTAQRELAMILIGDADALYERSFAEVARVELLARFLAIRSGNILDTRRLAGVLWQMARTAPTDDDRLAYASEAASLLHALADEGDGLASDNLAILASEFPELRAGLALADRASLLLPPPIVRSHETLGDLLAEALGYEPRTGFWGFVDRVRFALSDAVWSIRWRWWALTDKLRRS